MLGDPERRRDRPSQRPKVLPACSSPAQPATQPREDQDTVPLEHARHMDRVHQDHVPDLRGPAKSCPHDRRRGARRAGEAPAGGRARQPIERTRRTGQDRRGTAGQPVRHPRRAGTSARSAAHRPPCSRWQGEEPRGGHGEGGAGNSWTEGSRVRLQQDGHRSAEGPRPRSRSPRHVTRSSGNAPAQGPDRVRRHAEEQLRRRPRF